MNKKFFIIILALFVVCFLAISSALIASIGGSRWIFRTQPNVTVQGYILVKNVNEVPVNVTLTVSGDLANYTNLSKNFLTIMSNQSERVNFTILSPFPGTTTTKINALFSSGNQRIDLTGTIILIANETTAKLCDKRDRECRKICSNDYMKNIKDCNASYSFFVKYCNSERLEKREICTGLRGQERIECIKSLNAENRLCKIEALDAKTACRIRARTALLLCKG